MANPKEDATRELAMRIPRRRRSEVDEDVYEQVRAELCTYAYIYAIRGEKRRDERKEGDETRRDEIVALSLHSKPIQRHPTCLLPPSTHDVSDGHHLEPFPLTRLPPRPPHLDHLDLPLLNFSTKPDASSRLSLSFPTDMMTTTWTTWMMQTIQKAYGRRSVKRVR
ncbi:hypothetical protein FS842_002189 [Serendipita sp. 407]|nr:hypothetical protein FRC18_006343 [Serendipita sp. 400]KAG9042451.1 hypothetical protein FS842_002189 [Serendipita sp. 407]